MSGVQSVIEEYLVKKIILMEDALNNANLYTAELEETIVLTTAKVNAMTILFTVDSKRISNFILTKEAEIEALKRIVMISEKYNEELIEQLIVVCKVIDTSIAKN